MSDQRPEFLHPVTREHRPRERFLTLSMGFALALYGLFALTFSYFRVRGDALVYFNLLRRYFGEDPEFAYAYQYGSALWNTPFFLVGRALGAVFGFQPQTFHVSFEEVFITIATNAAFVVTLYLGWRILATLDLPRGPAVLLLTTFGTPLFFYVVFDPAAKHAVDTLVLTAAAYAFLRCDSASAVRPAIALGALAGWSLNIRWANIAFLLALGVALVLQDRWRLAGLAVGSSVVAGALILVLPALRGIDYYFPIVKPEPAVGVEGAAQVSVTPLDNGDPGGFLDLTIPLRMLFSEHRGLFLWTPLTAAAAIGFGLALWRARRGGVHFEFLAALLAASLALIAIHVFWPRWDGGFAFSQRFLTGLFPLFLIGVAELVRRVGWKAYPVLVLAAAFSLSLAFVRDVGYDGLTERDGVARIVEAGLENPGTYRHRVREDAEDRWAYLWALLHGDDPQHVQGPP